MLKQKILEKTASSTSFQSEGTLVIKSLQTILVWSMGS
jgi:hypothetical protein